MSILSLADMDGKSVFDDDMPSGLTPIVRTPSPYEFLPSYKLSEGSVYKSPIFIKTEETNTVPVSNDVNHSGDPSQMPDSKKSTNGLFCHEDYSMYNSKPEDSIMQDVTNVVKCEPNDEKPSVINGANKQDITISAAHSKISKNPPKSPHNLIEDYDSFDGKNEIDHPTSTEQETDNAFHVSSPRKARTRSVESAVWDIEEKRRRKGVKRPRSIETGPQTPSKLPKLAEKLTSQVPSSKQEHKQKEHRSKDKHEHRERGSKSSRDKKRRCSIGVQARPSQDSRRHHLKVMEPRPCLLESGNLSYPPSDVGIIINCGCTVLFWRYSAWQQYN